MMKANRKASKENLIVESENDSDYGYDNNVSGEIAEVEVYTNHSHSNETDLSYEDKSYIMQKFLDDKPSKHKAGQNHPIPKRRTKKTDGVGNENSNVKNFHEDDDNKSNTSKTSNGTYDIPIPIPKKRTLVKRNAIKRDDLFSATSTSASTSKHGNNIEMKEFVKYENEKKLNKSVTQKTDKKLSSEDETELGPNNNIINDSKATPKNKNNEKNNGARKKAKTVNIDDDDEKDIDEAECPDHSDDNKHSIDKKEEMVEILAVKISKTDSLQLNSYVLHPTVRMFLIDSENGEYIKKLDPRRNVVLKAEPDGESLDFIVSTMTKPYNLIQNKQIMPNWNEVMLINEDFNYLSNMERLIIFFEIIESTSAAPATDGDSFDESRYIAWAFLKPQNNFNQNLRLQLYYPQSSKNKAICNSFKWWKKNKLRRYPSTLYVSLNNTSLPHKVLKMWSSKSFNDDKENAISPEVVSNEQHENGNINDDLPSLKRLENHICKIPTNEKRFEIKTCEEGSFTHKFSNTGDYIAVAIQIWKENLHCISIYSIRNQEEFCRLESHQGLIYDLVWTRNDRHLISASADCTVAIWDVQLQKLEHILPHPTFVYCCATDNCIIATGSFDNTIRIWSLTSYTLLDELKEHKGYVTSICFNKEGYFMYSADSTGCIRMWSKEPNASTSIIKHKQEINVLDLKSVIINQLVLHKREKRLLVNSRDGFIRLIDIKTGYVLQTYAKGSKEKTNTTCALTPCGTYLISGNEAGDVFIWNVDNGKLEHVYSPYHVKIAIHCVQYHSKNNLIAMSNYGHNLPVIVYGSKDHVKEQQTNTFTSVSINNVKSAKADPKTDFAKVRTQGTNFRLILEKFDNIISISN